MYQAKRKKNHVYVTAATDIAKQLRVGSKASDLSIMGERQCFFGQLKQRKGQADFDSTQTLCEFSCKNLLLKHGLPRLQKPHLVCNRICLSLWLRTSYLVRW